MTGRCATRESGLDLNASLRERAEAGRLRCHAIRARRQIRDPILTRTVCGDRPDPLDQGRTARFDGDSRQHGARRIPYDSADATRADLCAGGGGADVGVGRARHHHRQPGAIDRLHLQQVGGASARVPIAETPYANREALYDCFPISIWDNPADDEAHIRWARGLWDAMRPFSTGGVYSNNLGDEGTDRVHAAYGENYPRLVALKSKRAAKNAGSLDDLARLALKACLIARDAAFNVRDLLTNSSRMAFLAIKDCEKELDLIERQIDERLPAAITKVNEARARQLLAEAGYPNGFKTQVESPGTAYGPDFLDSAQIIVKNWKAAGIDAELKLKEYGAFISSTIYGKFDEMMYGLRGTWTDPEAYFYRPFMPGQPLNVMNVNDPKLTEMIKLQRRTGSEKKRREIIYDIQRYCSQQVYYACGASGSVVAAWMPNVKEFGPNIGPDYGGRLLAVWLEK